MYFHFHNFTLPSLVHTICSIPHRYVKQGSHCTSTQLRDDWPNGTNQKLAISLILKKIIKNVICDFIMSVFQIFKAPVSSPASFAAWFQVWQLQKWNTLQHAALLRMSVESLTTIFVKIIFTHKSFLKIHLTVSWLNLLPQPPLRYLPLWTNEIPRFFNILIGSVHSQSASFSILTRSPDPLWTIYVTLKHLLSSILLGLMFQTAMQKSHMHPSQFRKKFEVNHLLQNMNIHFAMRDTNKHKHTHTHTHARARARAHVSTFSQPWHIWCYSVYITAYTRAKHAQAS